MPAPANHSAVVTHAKTRGSDPDEYLALAVGRARWTDDLAAATTFESMREATRAALALPGGLRAYSVPLRSELAFARLH